MVTIDELTDEEATQAADLISKTWHGKLLTSEDFEGKSKNALLYYVDAMERIRKGE